MWLHFRANFAGRYIEMRMRRDNLTMRTEGITAFSNRYGVVVWTGENDTKTISVDANLFKNGAKQPRFRLKTDKCGQGLKVRILSPVLGQARLLIFGGFIGFDFVSVHKHTHTHTKKTLASIHPS